MSKFILSKCINTQITIISSIHIAATMPNIKLMISLQTYSLQPLPMREQNQIQHNHSMLCQSDKIHQIYYHGLC